MVFNNSGTVPPKFNNLGIDNNFASFDTKRVSVVPKNIALNAPMIDRVYKAKPGCGACGKKVA